MKKRILSGALLACMLCVLLAGCQSGSRGNVASEARSGVVRVLSVYGDCTIYYYDTRTGEVDVLYTGETLTATGSAFGVGAAGKETDVFVTNRHVIAALDLQYMGMATDTVALFASGKLTRAYLLKDDYAYDSAMGLDLSRAVPCEVIYEADSHSADLAVLRAAEPMAGRVALPLLADGHEVDAGDTVYALGYPGSTDDATLDSSGNHDYAGSVAKVTVTNGVVSLHTSYVDDNDTKTNIIQHTATVNHGNSGGPLIDEHGAVVGVNTWIYGQDLSTGDSMSFGSVEVYYVRDILDSLRIQYDVYPGGTSPVLLGGIAAAAIIVLIVAVVVLARKPKPAPAAPAQFAQPAQPQAMPVQPQTAPVQPQTMPVQPQTAPVQAAPVIAGDTGLRIQGVAGRFANRRFAIAGQLRIGRDPARNDLVYPADSQGVSGVHCVLIVEGGRLFMKDLGSTYGTFVGGNRLAANAPMELRVGDRFCLGSERETFVIARKGEV